MDQFYKELRAIQKKERNNATLARVEENFYSKIHEYMDDLKQQAINDPFSNIPQILHEVQRIATEICERREHKITDAAVVNIHRSYHLFTGKPQFDLVDTTPLNLTPEEEKFYFSLIDTLKNHRRNISLEKLSDSDEIPDKKVIKPKDTQSNTLIPPKQTKNDDELLNRLDEISKAKPVVDKKREKHGTDSNNAASKGDVSAKPQVENIEDNPNAFDETEEFYDLESRKIAKDTELVTMLVFDEIEAIVGVDERVYGPFRPQDLVTLPLINAKVFFKNRKGRQVKI
ncbi:MAG: DNA replication complex subunit Gins51 [Methanobrevibacter sp.]